MGTKIKKIETYLPEKVVTNDQLETDFQDWSAKKVEAKTGIRERHIVSEGETALDLAYQASKKVLDDYDRDSIDFLIFCTQSPDYYLPSSSCILQDKIDLRTNIGAFDINLGCSGFIYGLALAKGLINTDIANNILLVTAEIYSKYIHPRDKANRTIFGDGAAATIIEKSEIDGILKFSLGTDGKGYDKLIVLNGGARNKYDPGAKERQDTSGSLRSNNNLYMDGPEIFNFTIKAVPEVVNDVLQQNNIHLKDLDYVIFHQANKFMNEHLRKKIGITGEKFYNNMLHTGNTVSASIPVALKDCIDRKIVKSGYKVLLVGFGVGYSWGATIIKV